MAAQRRAIKLTPFPKFIDRETGPRCLVALVAAVGLHGLLHRCQCPQYPSLVGVLIQQLLRLYLGIEAGLRARNRARQIACVAGLPMGTVMSRLSRARKQLEQRVLSAHQEAISSAA